MANIREFCIKSGQFKAGVTQNLQKLYTENPEGVPSTMSHR
jgi:hypothetical protein